MCTGSSSSAPVQTPPPPAAPQNDLLDVPAQVAREREVFRIQAAQGMKANFLTGLRGLEGGRQGPIGGAMPNIRPIAPAAPEKPRGPFAGAPLPYPVGPLTTDTFNGAMDALDNAWRNRKRTAPATPAQTGGSILGGVDTSVGNGLGGIDPNPRPGL